jgi:phosphoribosylanthranilate isomerase
VIKAIDSAAGDTAGALLTRLEPGSAIACMLDVSRGRGVEFDRDVAAGVAAHVPVWLAGGLTPENVADVLRRVRPWAVDVSSGVETNGVKDAAKMRAFVESVRMAEAATSERSP